MKTVLLNKLECSTWNMTTRLHQRDEGRARASDGSYWNISDIALASDVQLLHILRVRLVPFSVFLARLPPVRLPPARLLACIVSLFGCVHIQSQARESRRLVGCTR
jgi:hypothetical protein